MDYDDENPEVWYLLGVNANNRNPPDVETAQFSFQQAITLLEKEMKENPQQAPMLQGLFDLVQESMKTVGQCSGNNGTPHMASAFAAAHGVTDATARMDDEEPDAEAEEEWSDMEDE